MGKDSAIPLNEKEKALVSRYLKDVQELRGILNIKSQALDDILGVLIESKGRSRKDYVVDMNRGIIVRRSDVNVRPGEEKEKSSA